MGPEPEKGEVNQRSLVRDGSLVRVTIAEEEIAKGKALHSTTEEKLAEAGRRVIVALDYKTVEEAMPIVNRLDPTMCRLKIGKVLHSAGGPQFVEWCIDKGFDVFLDLKFHDIPNTVADACHVNAKLGVWMMNMHASGGNNMMLAARRAVDALKLERPPLLIAVTVLTSLDDKDLKEIGFNPGPSMYGQVLRLARCAHKCGLDGVVCSAKEAFELRDEFGDDFKIITPGTRPRGSNVGDQKRVMTPADAINEGSTYVVIGRPIIKADDPITALQDINTEIASVL